MLLDLAVMIETWEMGLSGQLKCMGPEERYERFGSLLVKNDWIEQ